MSHIVSLDLQSLDGMAGRITSVGHGFAAGDLAAGATLTAQVGGADVPLQMDVLSTWPDGSVKHAILSFDSPDIDGGTATLELAASSAPAAAATADIAALAAEQEYDFTVRIDGETVDVAALLHDGPVDMWQEGALVSQGRVTHTLANGLELRVDITVKADGTLDTSITIGNDNIETTGLDALTYAVEIAQNGEIVFANAALTQYHFTVWREKFSTEDAANTTHAVYDMTYLRGTGLLPSVDTGLTLADGDAYGEALADPNATYDPLELGGVDNSGGIDEDRGRSGVTKSYGVVTDDQHSYLVTQTAAAREGMLELTDQYGAYSDFYRNPETGEAYLLEDVDFNSYHTGVRKDVAGTDGVVDLRNDGLAQRNAPSHDPSAFYTSFLVTGDRFFADGLASEGGSAHLLWANATLLTADGAVDFGQQLRAQAWGLRDLFYAATLAPDASEGKAILEARLDAALQDYIDYYINGETLQNRLGQDLSGSREAAVFTDGPLSGVLQSFNGTGIDRPYWQDWFGAVIGQIAATGNEQAKAIGEWMANFSAGRFLQDDFDASNSLYSLTGSANGSRDFTADTTWADLQAIAVEKGTADAGNWQTEGFFTASAFGGTASLFSGTRDARYAEALLWMTGELSQDAEDIATGNGTTTQLAIPVQFLDNSIAGITDRTVGTAAGDTLSDGAGNRLIAAGASDDVVTTGAGNHLVDGGDGNDVLTGGAGEDWLFGGSGNDRIDGGAGVNMLQGDRYDTDFGRFADTFVFEGTLGDTTVIDFTAGQDTLELNGFSDMRRPGDVLSAFIDTGNGAVLDMGGAGRLLLRGVDTADLDADDLSVHGPNTGPVAGADDGGTVTQGEALTLSIADLLANDSDPESDAFTLVETGAGTGGTAVMNGDGTITFTADEGYVGEAYFSYLLRDDLGGEGTGTVSFSVETGGPDTPETTNTVTGGGWLHGTAANDYILPTSGNVRVFGRGGDDLIELNGWNTVAKGGAGDDTIVFSGSRHFGWGNDGADTFIVTTGNTRTDIIDFDVAEDRLYFADGAGGLSTAEDIEEAMMQAGDHVYIRFDDGLVRLRNTILDDLDQDNVRAYTTPREEVADTLTPPETTGDVITGSGWLNGTTENDMIVSGGGNVRLAGGFGDDHIIAQHWNVRVQGGAGDDLIESQAHDANLRGDAGTDTFLFRGRVDGRVTDFNVVEDRIALDIVGTGIADFDALIAMAEDGDQGVEIVGNDGDRLMLDNIGREMLTEDLFLFV